MGLLSIISLIVIGGIIWCTKDNCIEQFNSLKSMYIYLYRVHHDDHLHTIQHIITSTAEHVRIYLTQHVFHNSKRISKNLYEIEYTINCKSYRFRTKYKQGPSKYIQFMKNELTDVSDIIFPFVGPNDNFHNFTYTPKDFGLDTLTVHYMDGNVRNFASDEKIE
jgi:hypothetical protein